MKKAFKGVLAIILAVGMLATLCSCSKYISSYRAFMLVRTNTSHSCATSFSSLNGQLVFKIKKTERGTEGDINYKIELEEGEIRLYYDIYGVKEELAHVKAGESVESSGGYVEGGYPVYIIIEATGAVNGRVTVELDD